MYSCKQSYHANYEHNKQHAVFKIKLFCLFVLVTYTLKLSKIVCQGLQEDNPKIQIFNITGKGKKS